MTIGFTQEAEDTEYLVWYSVAKLPQPPRQSRWTQLMSICFWWRRGMLLIFLEKPDPRVTLGSWLRLNMDQWR